MNFRFHNEVVVPFGNIELEGELIIPSNANAVVEHNKKTRKAI